MMNKFSLFLTIWVTVGALHSSCNESNITWGPDTYVPDTSFKVVGYITAGKPEKLDSLELDRLTYLNVAFANPDSSGQLVLNKQLDIKPYVQKGHEAGLKVFISLAGGGKPDTIIWHNLLLPENRNAFIGKILDYVTANDLDGVDVDIEGNLLPQVGLNYNPFVVELRQALHSKGKGITAALGATHFHPNVRQEALEAYDFINVMVYDKTGIWRPEEIGPHSPWSYAEDAITYWTKELKIPANKITLGVPFYGFDFTPPARYISYREIIHDDPSLAYQDSVGMRYYNGIPMIARKTKLAKDSLGGVMIWEIQYDARDDMSLLRAMDQVLKAGEGVPSTYFQDNDGDGWGDLTKPLQSSQQPIGYVSKAGDPNDEDPKVKGK
jgi:spore germination protein YaaH